MLNVTIRAFFTLSGSSNDLVTNFILYRLCSGRIKDFINESEKGYAN